jgi:hypothetical protein
MDRLRLFLADFWADTHHCRLASDESGFGYITTTCSDGETVHEPGLAAANRRGRPAEIVASQGALYDERVAA